MCPVKVAVFIDHLRLNPNAKFHPLIMHTGNKLCQASPQFLFIDLPVPKGRIIIVSFPKPAVIHHYHINSKGSSFFCQIHDRISRKIEICCLPAVNQHRALHMDIFAAAHMVADAVMILLRQCRQSVCRIRQNDFRYREGFSFRKRIGKQFFI